MSSRSPPPRQRKNGSLVFENLQFGNHHSKGAAADRCTYGAPVEDVAVAPNVASAVRNVAVAFDVAAAAAVVAEKDVAAADAAARDVAEKICSS